MADGDRHKNPYVAGIRGATKKLRDAANTAAMAVGYPDLSAATVAYWQWLTRDPGDAEPRRPQDPAVVARQLFDQFADAVGTLGDADPAAAGALLDEAAALSRGTRDKSGEHQVEESR
jgi:hypothetical protein